MIVSGLGLALWTTRSRPSFSMKKSGNHVLSCGVHGRPLRHGMIVSDEPPLRLARTGLAKMGPYLV